MFATVSLNTLARDNPKLKKDAQKHVMNAAQIRREFLFCFGI
jgi:hypothetical protein